MIWLQNLENILSATDFEYYVDVANTNANADSGYLIIKQTGERFAQATSGSQPIAVDVDLVFVAKRLSATYALRQQVMQLLERHRIVLNQDEVATEFNRDLGIRRVVVGVTMAHAPELVQ